MAVSDAGGTNRLADRFKEAAPVAAAVLAVTVLITGVTLLTDTQETPPLAPGTSVAANVARESPAQTSQPGTAAPGVAFDQAPASGVRQMDMEIVVKFKDDAKVKDIVDAFWRDAGSAREKFDAFKARRPEFAGLKLDRVTYSNELVLVQDGGAPSEQRLTAMRALAKQIMDAADISYAEPNLMAQPGGQR